MLTEVRLPPTPRQVAASVDELLAGVRRRESFRPADSRSGSRFERVWLDDGAEPLVVKHLHPDDDFTMRVTGDTECRTLRAYAAGLYDLVPDLIDHGILGMAGGEGRNGSGAAILMQDLSTHLTPTGLN